MHTSRLLMCQISWSLGHKAMLRGHARTRWLETLALLLPDFSDPPMGRFPIEVGPAKLSTSSSTAKIVVVPPRRAFVDEALWHEPASSSILIEISFGPLDLGATQSAQSLSSYFGPICRSHDLFQLDTVTRQYPQQHWPGFRGVGQSLEMGGTAANAAASVGASRPPGSLSVSAPNAELPKYDWVGGATTVPRSSLKRQIVGVNIAGTNIETAAQSSRACVVRSHDHDHHHRAGALTPQNVQTSTTWPVSDTPPAPS